MKKKYLGILFGVGLLVTFGVAFYSKYGLTKPANDSDHPTCWEYNTYCHCNNGIRPSETHGDCFLCEIECLFNRGVKCCGR